MRPVIITKTISALDRDGIALAQTLAGAGSVTLNGVLVTGGIAVLDTSRIVGIYSAGNLSGVVFTVTGSGWDGQLLSETITGPNNATVSGVLMFKRVTSVTANGAVGTNVEVGTTGVGATQPVVLDNYISPFAVALFVEIASASTVNVTVQYTPDDIFNEANRTAALGVPTINWTNHASLTSKTASTDSNVAYPASAVRMLVNSGTDPATFIVRQAGY